MKSGFYTIIAAQFFSSLADNALLIAAIALLRELHEPQWMTPALKQSFVVSYVVLAPIVGAFADSMPKGRVMLITNAIKIAGCALMLFDTHPLLSYAIVGFGAAACPSRQSPVVANSASSAAAALRSLPAWPGRSLQCSISPRSPPTSRAFAATPPAPRCSPSSRPTHTATGCCACCPRSPMPTRSA
jgi:MFS family permease